jgi:uncharacterized protein YktA (UPF0223 family)
MACHKTRQAYKRIGVAGLMLFLSHFMCRRAHADVTVLVGEPYGSFGTMMPVGHAAIFLDRVCADGPVRLRMCEPGEAAGVVIARYFHLGSYDWVASPIMQFLYAVDRPEYVPAYATADQVAQLREIYRQQFFETIVPDGQQERKITDEWPETAGAAYSRKIWGYTIDSSREQDEQLVSMLNAAPNTHLYHVATANCADFAAMILNFYYPGIVRKADKIADFGWMSPKQVVRSVSAYAAANPSVQLRVSEIAQVPGTLRRSRPVRGGVEGTLKTKRYLFTLMVIQPEIPAITALLYLDHGRWQIGRGAVMSTPADFLHHVPGTAVASTGTPPSLEGSSSGAFAAAAGEVEEH